MERGVIKSYKDLEIWRRGIALVKMLYIITEKFPKSELYGLTNQLRRSAVSVPLNIAEGWGRETSQNYIQFLRNSKGSLFELDTIIVISFELKYIDVEQYKKIRLEIEEIGRMLNTLIKKLNEKRNGIRD